MLARDDESPPKRTPLHALHLSLGARMVPFAGYEMPVQYATGVLREHQHTRASAGLFDVSHMGQIALRARSGAGADAAKTAASALERLVPQDMVAVAPGRQRYAQFTNESGGILDDLMDHQIVENAAALVRELRVTLPSRRDGDHVLRHQPLQRACGSLGRVRAGAGPRAQRDLAHMRDVEQAGGGAGMLVLPEHAGCVLYGHLVARERHHSGPKREMERVQGRAFRGRLVVACKHHGPSRFPGPIPCGSHRSPICRFA